MYESRRPACSGVITTIALFLFFIATTGHSLAAGSEELTVTKVTRISHPAYRAGNLWYSIRSPWSSDYARILIYENPNQTPHPTYGKRGRGLVWGFVSDLKSWTTLAQYEAAAKPLPDNSEWELTSIYWSPFAGEENILYGLFKADKSVSKLNVDTGVRTKIFTYDPKDGTNVSNAKSYGWTADNKFTVNFDRESSTSGGYEVDVQNRAGERYSNRPGRCSANGRRWPTLGNGHGDKSPDGKNFVVEISDGVQLIDLASCTSIDFMQIVYPRTLSHFSWKASNDWFIADDRGEPSWGTKPKIDTMRVYQMWKDGTFKVILETMSAQYWYDTNRAGCGNGNTGNECRVEHWHARPIPVLRNDGQQVFFLSTDGKYSYEDYELRGSTPWAFEGFFLADVKVGEGGTDAQAPSAPTNLRAVPISESEIDLSWDAATDNVRVAGYRIFKNGEHVASINRTSYLSGGLQPSMSYTFAVSAYDASGNVSQQSQAVNATTKQPGAQAYAAARTIFPLTIDGDLLEFSDAAAIQFSPPLGGNTVSVRALWDHQGVYLGFLAADKQLNAQTTTRDGPLWNEDGVEWFIDSQGNGGGSHTSGAYMLPDDYHGIINLLNATYDSQGTPSGAPTTSWNGVWTSAVQLIGTLNNNGDVDHGYAVEVLIPWSVLGLTAAPPENTVLAMSFAMNDKDASTFSTLMWPSFTTGYENASKWQKVLLSSKRYAPPVSGNYPPVPPTGLRAILLPGQ